MNQMKRYIQPPFDQNHLNLESNFKAIFSISAIKNRDTNAKPKAKNSLFNKKLIYPIKTPAMMYIIVDLFLFFMLILLIYFSYTLLMFFAPFYS